MNEPREHRRPSLPGWRNQAPGHPDKRQYLKSLGVNNIMDSRSLDFVRETRERTNGEGVDVVLNSLAGEYIPASLSLLRYRSRFLEIGKRDILSDSKSVFRHFKIILHIMRSLLVTRQTDR